MSWVNALKEYSKIRGSFIVPAKGSSEYDEVKKIMADMKKTSEPLKVPDISDVEIKPKPLKKKKTEPLKVLDIPDVEIKSKPVKKKKTEPLKVLDIPDVEIKSKPVKKKKNF